MREIGRRLIRCLHYSKHSVLDGSSQALERDVNAGESTAPCDFRPPLAHFLRN